MTNPPKAKGTAFETAVVRYLNSRGIPCERRALQGINDKGDVAGIPGWVLECKNHRSIALASWASEAERERLQASEFYWAVVHKRYRRGTDESYVTIPLSTFADLIGGPGSKPEPSCMEPIQ